MSIVDEPTRDQKIAALSLWMAIHAESFPECPITADVHSHCSALQRAPCETLIPQSPNLYCDWHWLGTPEELRWQFASAWRPMQFGEPAPDDMIAAMSAITEWWERPREEG